MRSANRPAQRCCSSSELVRAGRVALDSSALRPLQVAVRVAAQGLSASRLCPRNCCRSICTFAWGVTGLVPTRRRLPGWPLSGSTTRWWTSLGFWAFPPPAMALLAPLPGLLLGALPRRSFLRPPQLLGLVAQSASLDRSAPRAEQQRRLGPDSRLLSPPRAFVCLVAEVAAPSGRRGREARVGLFRRPSETPSFGHLSPQAELEARPVTQALLGRTAP